MSSFAANARSIAKTLFANSIRYSIFSLGKGSNVADTSRNSDIRMKGFRFRHDVDALIRLIDERIRPVGTEALRPDLAAGRRLAGDIVAVWDVPGFDRAAMDGYALRGEETNGATPYNELPFRLLGQSLPGKAYVGEVAGGQAVRIMTGAAMPAGTDAVAMAETAREEADSVHVAEAVSPARNVGRIGEDVRRGSVVLSPPRTLRPQDIAVAIGAGVAELSVHRRPTVQILVTGNELLPPGAEPRDCQIVDTNSAMLAALIDRDGGIVANRLADGSIPILPDDRDAIRRAISNSRADCILLCGGSSVGQEDHGPSIVAELGDLPIHGLALRPASPAGLGFVADRPVFLLPGNPVSCLCAYDLFVGRAIRIQGGRDAESPYRKVTATLAENLTSAIGRVDYVRVRWTAPGRIEPLATSGAAILSSTVRAAGYVLVPKDSEGYAEETEVAVYLYDASP